MKFPGTRSCFFAWSISNDVEIDIPYDQGQSAHAGKLEPRGDSRDLFFQLPENFFWQMAFTISPCCELIKRLVRDEAG